MIEWDHTHTVALYLSNNVEFQEENMIWGVENEDGGEILVVISIKEDPR